MLISISKLLFLFTTIVFSFAPGLIIPAGYSHTLKVIKWSVKKSSTIRIQGSTNVNKFGCEINGYYQADTITCSEENAIGKLVKLNGGLQVDLLEFDCHNSMLTKDLRKTLKADEYPKLLIRFLSLERTPVIQNSKDCLKGWVEVVLAGSCKRFEVDYSFNKTGSSLIQLNGTRSFSFADFKLCPPKKFAGLIKVNDKFIVDFNLLLDPIE